MRLLSIKIGPLDIYNLLPRTNCKECGESNCMAFAAKLLDRTTFTLDMCKPLFVEERYRENLNKLQEMLRPPVEEVTVGKGENSVKIGGKLVLYRHELKLTNPTAIAIDVTDQMLESDLIERVKTAESFNIERIGEELKLNMIAIRSLSGEPSVFGKTVANAIKTTRMPLILCSLDTNVIEAGLMEAKENNPLIYAATTENWKEMGELALMYGCPIVVSSANIENLRSIVNALMKMGIQNIILDPGSTLNNLSQTVNIFTQIRKSALRQDDIIFGFPIMGIPLTVWSQKERRETSKWNEACLASILMTRYADMLIMHSLDVWSLLPLVTLRQNLYTDPRKPVAVDPGLREFGTPDENSPVGLTTNFSLTYFTVASDIESSRIDCYLLVADSEGLSVETAVAGRKLTAVKVAEILESSKIGDKVKHNKLIIPGRAARLSGEIEQVTGWEILVGPEDSSALAGMIKKRWNTAN